MRRWDQHDPTDLEDLARWTTSIIILGGIAVAIVVGAVALALWVL